MLTALGFARITTDLPADSAGRWISSRRASTSCHRGSMSPTSVFQTTRYCGGRCRWLDRVQSTRRRGLVDRVHIWTLSHSVLPFNRRNVCRLGTRQMWTNLRVSMIEKSPAWSTRWSLREQFDTCAVTSDPSFDDVCRAMKRTVRHLESVARRADPSDVVATTAVIIHGQFGAGNTGTCMARVVLDGVMERIVARQLMDYLKSSKLLPIGFRVPIQSSPLDRHGGSEGTGGHSGSGG